MQVAFVKSKMLATIWYHACYVSCERKCICIFLHKIFFFCVFVCPTNYERNFRICFFFVFMFHQSNRTSGIFVSLLYVYESCFSMVIIFKMS